MSAAIARRRSAGFGEFAATGGTVTTATIDSTTYTVHTFTSGGTFTVDSGRSNVEVFAVGGGGGGGSGPGGGGGGGYTTTDFSVLVRRGAYAVTVGAGGKGQDRRDDGGAYIDVGGSGSQPGGASSLGTLVTAAGGLGAGTGNGANGGSGGGGGGSTAGFEAGGNGGTNGGNGGAGVNTAGTGQGTTTRQFEDATLTLYSGGGGGGARGATAGSGGAGGGGAGGTLYQFGVSGTDGLGGGGGGGGRRDSSAEPNRAGGGAGGSGIVIIRYEAV